MVYCHLVIGALLKELAQQKPKNQKEADNILKTKARVLKKTPMSSKDFPSSNLYQMSGVGPADVKEGDDYCALLREEIALRLTAAIYGSGNESVKTNWLFYAKRKFLNKEL